MTDTKEQPHSFESEWEKMKDKFACDVASEYSDVVTEQQDCRWHVSEGIEFVEQNLDKNPRVAALIEALEAYANEDKWIDRRFFDYVEVHPSTTSYRKIGFAVTDNGPFHAAREALKKLKEEK